MKKSFFVLVSVLLIGAYFFYFFFFGRYKINSPMMDYEYKKAIIQQSLNPFYKLENLRPVVGETELEEFIKRNDSNPQIYTPSKENIDNGVFRANLHMHTLNSDGKASVKQHLDFAENYASKNLKDGYMYIAITDHNTVNGAKDVVKVLQKYPNKYKHVKVVLGMEIYSAFKSKYYSEPIDIHVLTWCINPYDKFLNKEFYKSKDANLWNNNNGKTRDFDFVISTMSDYGIPGIAHPVRYTNRIGKNKILYIEEMFNKYKSLSKKPLFAEGYYQVYSRYYPEDFVKNEIVKYNSYIQKRALSKKIVRTGSTDAHSLTIFD